MIGRYYIGTRKTLSVLIPKKIGSGYLKSPFGGHHANEQYSDFTDSTVWGDLKNIVGWDVCDIDGYLAIGLCSSSPSDEDIQKVLKELQRVFPRISEWDEWSEKQFFNYILKQ